MCRPTQQGDCRLDQGLSENVKVVIRSVGERTEQACIDAIRAQGIGVEEVSVVRESPFVKALRSSFEIGLNAGRDWTFCVDADVILRPGSVAGLLTLAQAAPRNTFEVQGLMLDKFTIAIRAGGVHLYRTSLLEKALKLIPEAGEEIRPETFVLHRMQQQGYPWTTRPYVVGVHDFGQYFEDIYRKCYVHANKHLLHIPELLPHWRSRATTDPDFQVAIEGLTHGLRESGAIRIDKELAVLKEGFASLGMDEKSDALTDELSPAAIDKLLETWSSEQVIVHGFPVTARQAIGLGPQSRLTLRHRLTGSLRGKVREFGLIRTLLYIIGRGLELAGASIKRISSGRKGT